MIYSSPERVSITEPYHENGRYANIIAYLFNNQNPDKRIIRKYDTEFIAKFTKTELVANRKRNHPNEIMGNDTQEVAVLGHVSIDPTYLTFLA